jgi:tetratricopeptide (TPR) repeat protein
MEPTVDVSSIESGIQQLVDLALIKRDSLKGDRTYLSIHRMPQDAFRHSVHGLRGDLAPAFNAAIALVLAIVPKTPGTLYHANHWNECYIVLPHALSLVDQYTKSQRSRRPIRSSAQFLELLQHMTWFLYEIGDLHQSLKYLEIAKQACPDSQCLDYARFCNTAAVIWYELNNLVKCRENNEKCYKIYTALLAPDDIRLAHSYNNLALLSFSEKGYGKSLEHSIKSREILMKQQVVNQYALGLNSMVRGRIHFVQGDHDEASKHWAQSSEIFSSSGNKKTWLMGRQVISKPLEDARS